MGLCTQASLGKRAVDAPRVRLKLFNKKEKTWYNVKEGYQLLVQSREHIYIAAAGVTDMPDLDAQLAKDAQASAVNHLRQDLPRQRAAVREREAEALLASAPPPRVARFPNTTTHTGLSQPHRDTSLQSSRSHACQHAQPSSHAASKARGPLPPSPARYTRPKASPARPLPRIKKEHGVNNSNSDTVVDLTISPTNSLPSPSSRTRQAHSRAGAHMEQAIYVGSDSDGEDTARQAALLAAVRDRDFSGHPKDEDNEEHLDAHWQDHYDWDDMQVLPQDLGSQHVLLPSDTAGGPSKARNPDYIKDEPPSEDDSMNGLSGVSSDSTSEDNALPRWPRDWATRDVVRGFRKCGRAAAEPGKSVAKVFEECFAGVKYKPSTFYTHRTRWDKASTKIQQKYLNLGKTEAGRWKHFMREAPDPRGNLKMAQKRVARVQNKELKGIKQEV